MRYVCYTHTLHISIKFTLCIPVKFANLCKCTTAGVAISHFWGVVLTHIYLLDIENRSLIYVFM